MTLVQEELSIFDADKRDATFTRCRRRRRKKNVGRTLLSAAFEVDLGPRIYRFSKSTGSLTSCTLKYFASAGYFFAAASYIA